MKNISNIIGLMSGKGGVGKSTLSALLARALTERNLKVGLLDADLYGPSSQLLLPLDTYPEERDGVIYPAKSGEIACISLSAISKGEIPAMVRAPIANQLILQFLEEVQWGALDYLIIDFPPGTGDIQLTLMQHAHLTGTLAITSPSELSLLDVRKAIHMSTSMQVPVLGIIENYSYYLTSDNKKSFPFGKEGGRKLAREYNLPLLGELPLDPIVSGSGDRGENIFEKAPETEVVFLLRQLACKLHCTLLEMSALDNSYLKEFNLQWDSDLC